MDPLQGLTLYHVRFQDGEKQRSVLYKISLAEMLVPYSSPLKSWSFRNAFDIGEYGLGKTLHPLVKGVDVPENSLLFDTALSDDRGGETKRLGGIAAYERDTGLLWKHRDAETGESWGVRDKVLVVTFITTIGNYDYGINYVFHRDGVIAVEPYLTGILLAKGTALEKNPCVTGCQPLVEKNILAPPHQHFFNFRMDLDVDGPLNSPQEAHVRALPAGKDNPDRNAFEAVNTTLRSEKLAARDHDFQAARKWKVMNPKEKNALGHPTGYMLMPGETGFPYLSRENSIRKRAGFINHAAWFTAYRDGEQSAAADFPTTAPEGQGLPAYIADDQPLIEKDVVLWFTFGVTHVPRPEEWPVMNMHKTGFMLMPVNFFSRNPMLK
jgi:primary-amine oxidase